MSESVVTLVVCLGLLLQAGGIPQHNGDIRQYRLGLVGYRSAKRSSRLALTRRHARHRKRQQNGQTGANVFAKTRKSQGALRCEYFGAGKNETGYYKRYVQLRLTAYEIYMNRWLRALCFS